MVFSDTSGKLGIVEDIDYHIGSDSNTYPLKDKARNVNAWLDRVVSLILQSDGKWEWQDLNESNLPIGTQNLVSGTQEYSINTTYLKIRAVAVKDPNGVFHYLDRIDEKSPTPGAIALTDSSNTSGTPIAYALVGKYIVLNRKPNYTQSNGIQIYAQTDETYFASNDTTATPGFAKQFHRILSFGAALDYAIKHELSDKVISRLQDRIDKLEAGLMEYYSSRDQDRKISLSLETEDYGITDSTDLSSSKQFNI